MSARGYTRLATVVLALFYLSFPRSVHAYVDPGTGSYILQVLIAAVAAASLSLRIFWGRIKLLIARSGKKAPSPARDDATEES